MEGKPQPSGWEGEAEREFFFASFGDGAGENFPIRNKNLFWSLEGREGMAGRRRGTYYPSLLRCLVTDIGCLLFLA
jgi:hypothetical protein